MWTDENDSNTLRVDGSLRFQKYLDTCGQRLGGLCLSGPLSEHLRNDAKEWSASLQPSPHPSPPLPSPPLPFHPHEKSVLNDQSILWSLQTDALEYATVEVLRSQPIANRNHQFNVQDVK